MIKNFALTSFALMMLFIFSDSIKAKVVETRMSFAMSRIDMSAETERNLDDTVERVANGYRKRAYTDQEKISIANLLGEIRSFQGKELPDDKARTVDGRLNAILKRHGL